ncbi:MAG: CRTAC1 family protein [Planctomycetota bacterium]|jgi:hypothetical protein
MTENSQNDSRGLEPEEQDDAIIGVAFQWSLAVIVVLVIAGGAAFYFFRRPEPEPEIVETKLAKVEVREAPTLELPEIRFTDITESAGITFRHENGAYGKKLLPETMGGGCAFFDFDSDGDQDLLLVNSRRWSWDPRGPAETPNLLALYENDGTGHFQDVTAGSGLDISLYGMGAAIADYDGDGRPDVFVSAVGSNRLFHNEGGGKFVDVTESAGVGGDSGEWSTSCGWFDFDRDGDLDLFVCNYVKWTREFDEVQNFQLTGGGEAYGRPQNFEGTFPYLYRNDRNGTFTEVGELAGLHVRNPATDVALAKSLGTTFADFDGDGWLDIIVANDTVQNLMFRNIQNGQFEEMGAIAGVAFDMNGAARGAMGIDSARFRNNDAVGIAIGNFSNEMTALYVSSGSQMQFMDEAVSTGLGPNTRLELTFGVLYVDCDLDGRLDLFCSNGHLEEDINRVQASQHYEQPQQLFWNCGAEQDTEFMPVTKEKCGADLLKPMVGRGAACADIDNDGDQDLIVTSVGSQPRLLRNDQQIGHHWLKFKLIGNGHNRDAIGAMIEVRLKDRTLRRSVMPTRSYLSQSELPVTFGVGESADVESVSVTWPDGRRQKLVGVELDQLHVVRQED